MGRIWSALAAPFRRFGAATKRAITSLPWASGGSLVSGPFEHRALALVPVFASVRLLASSVASLPIQLYRREGSTRIAVSYIPQLLFQPAAVDRLYQWLQKCVISLALRGNAYGMVTQRDDLDFPTMIEWLNPDDVWVDELHPTRPVYYWMGREVPTRDIVHIPWFVLPGRVVGLSPMAQFAHTIGHGLQATEYGLSWFVNGGTPPAVLKNTAKALTPETADEASDRVSAAMRSRKPLVVGQDWDFTALKVSPEESQFVETMRLNASQIASIYGVPPTKVGGDAGGSMTYANVEQEGIDFVTFSLRPWLVLLEEQLSALMPGREFVKFNADALVRTSLLDRYSAHGMALDQGWRSVDEVRALEDLPPLPNGQGETYRPRDAAVAPSQSREASNE